LEHKKLVLSSTSNIIFLERISQPKPSISGSRSLLNLDFSSTLIVKTIIAV